MLWREHYNPRILSNTQMPEVEFEWLKGETRSIHNIVLVGGFGLAAVADQGIWLKLFDEAFPGDPNVFRAYIATQWSFKNKRDAMAVVPPSQHGATLLITDPLHGWTDLVKPERVDRGFAAIVHEKTIKLLMIGPPTEETWDEFRDAWTALRT